MSEEELEAMLEELQEHIDEMAADMTLEDATEFYAGVKAANEIRWRACVEDAERAK